MIKVRVEELLHIDNYTRIELRVFEFPAGAGYRDIRFKFFAIPEHAGIEFRFEHDWEHGFLEWPAQTVDQYGPYFSLDTSRDFRSAVSRVRGVDLEFLKRLVDALGEILPIALRECRASEEATHVLTVAADRFRKRFTAIHPVRQRSGPGGDEPDPAAAMSAELPLSCVQIGAADAFLVSQSEADCDGVVVSDVGGAFRIEFGIVPGWMRLLAPLPDAGTLCRDGLFLRLKLRSGATAAKAATIGIGHFDQRDYFHTAHVIAHDVVLPKDHGTIDVSVPPLIFRRCLHGVGDAAVILLFIEFREAGEIEYTPFAPDDDETYHADIPYRRSDDDVCAELLTINRSLADETGVDHLAWLTKEAELAYRLGCENTAASLVAHLLPDLGLLDGDARRLFLRVFVDLAISEDRDGDVSDILLANYDLTASDDHLFTALSLCHPGHHSRTPADDTFVKLPSGRWNLAYLSRHPITAKAIDILADADADEQSHLLAANQFRASSPSLYLEALNGLLAGHHVAPLQPTFSATTATASSVLESLHFGVSPPRSRGPKVSVIMSVRNAAATVSHAIRSILEQSYQPLELLVCDDGSTDGSADAIAEWRHDHRVRIFRSNSAQGTNNVRNSLIDEAAGTYITFQDACAVSHPQRVQSQLQVLERGSAIGVIARALAFYPDGALVFTRAHSCIRPDPGSLMASAEVFRKYGGYRAVACAADAELIARIRIDAGIHAVATHMGPLVFRAASPGRSLGLAERDESDREFSREALRTFAEVTARERLLGPAIVPDLVIDGALRDAGLARSPSGVVSPFVPA